MTAREVRERQPPAIGLVVPGLFSGQSAPGALAVGSPTERCRATQNQRLEECAALSAAARDECVEDVQAVFAVCDGQDNLCTQGQVRLVES